MFNRTTFTLLFTLIISAAFAQEVVINEICNNPPQDFETEDWIELYNNGSASVNLTGWELKDDDDTHVFVFPNVSISPQEYLIVCREKAAFDALRPGFTSVGDTDFGFSSDGDCVRLFDSSGQTIDEVCYEEEAPWPKANLGRTLGLIDPNMDNSVASSWQLFGDNGTPGAANVFSGILSAPNGHMIASVYPNPVLNENFHVQLENTSEAKVSLISIEGKIIPIEVMSKQEKDVQFYLPSNVVNGTYFLKIEQKAQSYIKKLIIKR